MVGRRAAAAQLLHRPDDGAADPDDNAAGNDGTVVIRKRGLQFRAKVPDVRRSKDQEDGREDRQQHGGLERGDRHS